MVFFASGLLWAALVFVIIEIIGYIPRRQEPEFGVTAVTLVSYLDAISFITGFSIGWALSILNIALGLALTGLTTHYKRQILFATVVSLLLALSLRGHFQTAFYMLLALLAVTALGAAAQAVHAWWLQEKQGFSSSGIVMVACLAGVVLLTSAHSPSFGLGLALFTSGASVLIGLLSTQYRPSFLIVSAFSLLWAIAL